MVSCPGRYVVQAVDPKAQVAWELAEIRAGVDGLCAVFGIPVFDR